MLQLGCWNINGFSSQKLLDVNIEKFDIFGIVESWTSDDSHVNLPSFEFIHEPGAKKRETEVDAQVDLFYISRKD